MKAVLSMFPHNPFLRVLTHRDFRSLWFAQILSQLAMNMLLFTLALQVYQFTGSNTAVSGLFLAFSIPAVLVGMAAGTVVDYVDKRTVLVLADITRAFGVGLLYVFLNNIIAVYIIVCINAVISQFYVPSEAPLIPRFVPNDQILTANSLFSFTYYSSMGLGFILAGPVLRVAGLIGTFIVISVFFLLAAYNVSKVPKYKSIRYVLKKIIASSPIALFKRMIVELQKGIRYVQSNETIRDALILLAVTQIILAILGVLGPGFADRMLSIDIRDASVIIIGPVVLGIILGALWVGETGARTEKRNITQIGMIGVSVMLVSLAGLVRISRISSIQFAVSQWIIVSVSVLLFIFLGVFNSFLDVPSNSILQKEAKGEMRGRIYGLLTAVVGGIGVMPVIIGGVLADTIGIGKTIFLLGIFVMIYGIYRMKFAKNKA